MKKAIFGALLLISAPVWAQPEGLQVGDSDIGPVLQNADGMTLYTYRNDPEGRSVCVGGCAAKWPPLAAKAEDTAAEDYSIITREDGSLQWAYQGRPLYTWVMDMEPGHATGDGVGGVWQAVRPAAAAE